MELTSPGSAVGTVAYMSPEQAKGVPLDARTDLFSLGTVIYEMATGKTPFAGESTAEVFAALLKENPPPVSSLNPAMPKKLDAIVEKLLRKDPAQRYATRSSCGKIWRTWTLQPSGPRRRQRHRSGRGWRRGRAVADCGGAGVVEVEAGRDDRDRRRSHGDGCRGRAPRRRS